MKSLMPVNAQYETLILIRLRLFVQPMRARGSRKQLLGSLSTGHGAVEAGLKTRETAAA